jgi:hypothetical protein
VPAQSGRGATRLANIFAGPTLGCLEARPSWLQHQARRHINTQLNKGESLHSLREFLFFAVRGKIRRKQDEEQGHQAMYLNLLTNCVITWNTVYMAAIIDQLRREDYSVQESDLAYLSPCRCENINPYYKYDLEVSESLRGAKL